MLTFLNNDWPEIPVDQFERFLVRCEDFTRTSYVGTSHYHFRRGNRHFASVTWDSRERIERVVVNPQLIESR